MSTYLPITIVGGIILALSAMYLLFSLFAIYFNKPINKQAIIIAIIFLIIGIALLITGIMLSKKEAEDKSNVSNSIQDIQQILLPNLIQQYQIPFSTQNANSIQDQLKRLQELQLQR